MKKKFMTLALTAAMAASMGMTAFAGQWVQNTTGWWWQEDNGNGLTEIRTGSTSAMPSIPTDISIQIQQLRMATPSMRTVPG